MRRVLAGILSTLCMISGLVRADEGMWLLPLIEKLNMPAMQELGFRLTAEDIYSINHSSLKDAVVIFGNGCTGEIVSDNGLLFTNHHCGFDYIQDHSTVEHDYLQDGFWASSHDEELPNRDLEVRFLKRIENVTDCFQDLFADSLSMKARRVKIDKKIESIMDSASEDGKFEAKVVPFFAGNEYYLFVYQVYKDVRLVGTPPSSIGKFGYDTDNWEWPRHTGDFSIFRIYTAPDGSPADYSPDNIPLKSEYSLHISLNGISEGDPTFILGYPGKTNRYLCSFGIREIMDVTNTTRVKIRSVRQDILKKDMQSDPKVQIQYAAKYSNSSNYWKYSIGQNRRLDVLDVLHRKQQEETLFRQWTESDSLRKVKYGSILDDMRIIYDKRKSHLYNFYSINESFFIATELIGFIVDFQYLNILLQLNSTITDEIQEEIETLKLETGKFFKDFNEQTDRRVACAMFELFKELIPEDQLPDIYNTIQKKYKGNPEKFIHHLYSNTLFLDEEKVMKFLDHPQVNVLNKDFGFQVTRSIFSKYYEEYSLLDAYETDLENLDRLYMKALMEMYPGRNFYPDANLTMRMTYGKVSSYSPGDAVEYNAFTTLKGIIEKEDTSNFEFIVPDKLKELYKAKDFGRYGSGNRMPVCFITDNDITGGNSGSPVLNADGDLIGLAFDGNWEAMSGDISYEPNLQRCICVDIRYVLFIIDKYAHDTELINELIIDQ
jgi:hypothetical protein